MTHTAFAWRGEDDPSRVDHAEVRFDDRGMSAHGTSLADAYALSWSLDARDLWVTRELAVTVHGDGWSRWIVLTRSSPGTWSIDAGGRGRTTLPSPGSADPGLIQGALDCDLGLCPMTNTMPIRRLGMLEHDVPATALVMAWVEVPSLRVLRSDQVYASVGRRSAGFRSGDFYAEIPFDDDGVVLDYPQLARRVSPV